MHTYICCLKKIKLVSTSVQIALAGNPNSGKSSLFNALSGLNQKVGNFPGVTVDKKTGICALNETMQATIIDLPGSYSLYPRKTDEWVAYNVLMGKDDMLKPDMVVMVIDASNLKRNLLYCSQILDLKYPVVIALTMMDMAQKSRISINIEGLSSELGVPVVPVNPRNQKGIKELKKILAYYGSQKHHATRQGFIDIHSLAPVAIDYVRKVKPGFNDYTAIHFLMHQKLLETTDSLLAKAALAEEKSFNLVQAQGIEIIKRYQRIRQILHKHVRMPDPLQQRLLTDKLDDIFLHRAWGYLILLGVLFLLFQSVFWIAQYPMDLIDHLFLSLQSKLDQLLPQNGFTSLLTDGLLAGLNGIMVFVPQIMILFGLITLLEDSGYMARISFLSDKLMRKAGLNGKSVMPMISGFACAVPAIMSARNIENRKERLLTILITPLMSCSARLPVFTILVALVIPNTFYLGFISLQGLVMMGLYVGGVIMALLVSYVLHKLIRSNEKSYFILELPLYRSPRWKNVITTMLEKAKIFITDAGKVIMVISLLLWFLSSYGPSKSMQSLSNQKNIEMATASDTRAKALIDRKYATAYLENSYAGILGKTIEPLIKPLGYDWKIGIALITSFAAREVFVGTMATLYSVEEEETVTLRQKMQAARKPDGTKVYTLDTGVSLMIFYLLAMQCMSTLAVVKRETKTWKWPLIQLAYMTVLAYIMSWLAYQVLQ